MGCRTALAAIGAVVAALAVAAPAFAHTGGGTAGLWEGLTHPVLGVDHVLAMISVGILAMTMARPLAAPAAFVGAMVVGGALGIAGMPMPGGEMAIAVSVAALGAALVAGRDLRATTTLALIGLAGFLHGHAHGVEAPASAHPIVYVLGFVVATAALHLGGAGIGASIRRHHAATATVGVVVIGAGAGLVAGFI